MRLFVGALTLVLAHALARLHKKFRRPRLPSTWERTRPCAGQSRVSTRRTAAREPRPSLTSIDLIPIRFSLCWSGEMTATGLAKSRRRARSVGSASSPCIAARRRLSCGMPRAGTYRNNGRRLLRRKSHYARECARDRRFDPSRSAPYGQSQRTSCTPTGARHRERSRQMSRGC